MPIELVPLKGLAFMGSGPADPDACDIIHDAKTASIVRVFTVEKARGRGIATALLNRLLEWARSEGYERCAVDFEPINTLAARFWMKHFHAVAFSLFRHMDERIAWAHERHGDQGFW